MIFRSKPYLAIVRDLPCMNCGRIGCTQAAHSNQLRFGKGRSIKGSDATAMALCKPVLGVSSGCHGTHDQGGKRKKLEWWEFEYKLITLTVMTLISRKKLVGAPEIIANIPKPGISFEAAALYLIGAIEKNQLQVAR
jgi:hypothetical protein